MNKKRIGNDVVVFWTVFYPGGAPVDFTVAKDIVLEVHLQDRSRKYVRKFMADGNKVEIQFPAGEQVHTGLYNVWLQWKIPDDGIEGGEGTHTMDWDNAFELVEKTSQLKGLNADPIYLQGFVSYGLTKKDKEDLVRMMLAQPGLNTIKGDSAYQVAVDDGYAGTKEEWLRSLHGKDGKDFKYDDFTPEQIEDLQLPATEAAETARNAAEATVLVGTTVSAAEEGRQAKYEGLELVAANALLEDAGKIQALIEFIINSVYEKITVGLLNVTDLRIQGARMFLSGTTAPGTPPEFIGQVYINTVGKIAYTATGVASVADWKQQ